MGGFKLNQELISAILWGMLPAIAWAVFWVKTEERKYREPVGLLTIVFIIGMLCVLLVIPVQHLVLNIVSSEEVRIFIWAFIEEFAKYFIIFLIIKNNRYVNDPVDIATYFIVGALGFAGLENILFLMNPELITDFQLRFVTGNLRYLGSTLLHAICSAIVGIGLGISFYQNWHNKTSYLIGGLIAATTLHAIFNLFIMRVEGQDILKVFGLLWVITIITILLLEKLRRLNGKIINT